MKYDADKILEEIESLPEYKRQPQFILQGVEGQTDKNYGTGKILNLGNEHEESDFIYPLYDIPYTNQILKDLGLYRTRIMCMRPKTCYTLHWDWSKRIHIPLRGKLDMCFMLVDGEVVWMKERGKVYHVDTTKEHTAVNASKELRWHLVGLIND